MGGGEEALLMGKFELELFFFYLSFVGGSGGLLVVSCAHGCV